MFNVRGSHLWAPAILNAFHQCGHQVNFGVKLSAIVVRHSYELLLLPEDMPLAVGYRLGFQRQGPPPHNGADVR